MYLITYTLQYCVILIKSIIINKADFNNKYSVHILYRLCMIKVGSGGVLVACGDVITLGKLVGLFIYSVPPPPPPLYVEKIRGMTGLAL